MFMASSHLSSSLKKIDGTSFSNINEESQETTNGGGEDSIDL